MQSVLDVLLREYPGDAAWKKYADCIQPDPTTCKKIASIPDDITRVLIHHCGSVENAKSWMVTPCKALSLEIPSSVLTNHPMGKKILKSVLMRMP